MMNIAENSQTNWVVILGDQVRSREAIDRPSVLEATRQAIDDVNSRFQNDLTIPFSLSQGDEVQALACTPQIAWDVLEAFDSSFAGGAFRYALGIGSISTALSERTWDMDGTCFHRARDAMGASRDESRWVTVRGFGDREDAIVNGVIRSLQIVREGWTGRQREAYSVRRRSKLQIEAAETMGLSQATLSKMLKSAQYRPYLEMERALRDLLGLVWRGQYGESQEMIGRFVNDVADGMEEP